MTEAIHFDVNQVGSGIWPRGRAASISGGKIQCSLGMETYDLTESYRYSPHLDLLKCKLDEDLARFVEKWGPLYLTQAGLKHGVSVIPTEHYWTLRGWLRAVVYLIAAFSSSDEGGGQECRKWLEEFFKADLLRQQHRKVQGPVPYSEILTALKEAESGIWSEEPSYPTSEMPRSKVPRA